MEEDRTVQVVCTKAEYQQFKNIYDGLCDLIDYKGQPDSIYIYNQKKVFQNITKYWPLIERLAKESGLELKVSPDDYKNIIFGFDRKAIARLYDSDRYPGVPAEHLLGLEEKTVKENCHSILSDILIKLESLFELESQLEQDEFTEIENQSQIKDEELTNEQAVELLGGGISKGTISKWVQLGLLKHNGKRGKQHRVIKSSVLLLKAKRDQEKEIAQAVEKFRVDKAKK